MSSYKASIYNYFFNSINTIVVIVNGIIMVPIYFRYMSVSTYGAWLATGNVVAMLGLLEGGFASVITQKMASAKARGNSLKLQYLSGANIATSVILAFAVFFLGMIIVPFITDWVNVDIKDSNDIRTAYIIALLSSSFALVVSLLGAFPQVWQDTKFVGLINSIVNLVAIISLIFYLFMGFGVISIALSYLTRSLLNLVFQGCWILKKWKKEKMERPLFSVNELRSLMRSCFYPFLSKMSGVLMNNSQSFIIAHFLNPVFATVYDLTSKVCYVACSFVSMTNGSFFALFSLTLASKEQTKINSVFLNTSRFFLLSLAIVALYSICFTEPIVNYWVGLDKFGGIGLLFVIVVAKVVFQIKSYFNNILYTGGMIDKSAKLDILCVFCYISILFLIIHKVHIYAVPLATLITGVIFIGWYNKLLYNNFSIGFSSLYKDSFTILIILSIFIVMHFILNLDYTQLFSYSIYFVLFSVVFFGVLFLTNKLFFYQIITKVRKK